MTRIADRPPKHYLRQILQLLLLLFIFCVPGIAARGEYMDLSDLLVQTGSSLEWEPLRGFGRIVKGDDWVVFKLGAPFYLLGRNEKVPTKGIMRRDGGIVFPMEAAQKISGFLTSTAEVGPRVAVILIDPGHGGRDPGAIGTHPGKSSPLVVQEKEVVLDVAQQLFRLLAAEYPGKRIRMTRESDVFLELEERTDKANNSELGESEAIIFISLHANAAFTEKPRGYEVWYLPPEYKRDLLDGSDVDEEAKEIIPILNTMLEVEYATESAILATTILQGLEDVLGDVTPNRGLKEETWFVVRKSKMPSVLIELGFVTNPEEALLLRDDRYLQKLADGIYNGIRIFIDRFEKTKGFTE